MRRELRKWITTRATDVGLALTPRLSRGMIERIGGFIALAGKRMPVVARNVAGNMGALGVGSRDRCDAYFKRVGEHYAGALHALRCASRGAEGRAELLDIAAERIELDASFDLLRGALAGRRGAILVGPHIANYLLGLALLNRDVPLTVYLRYSKDRRRRTAKQRWYQASGVDWISEPAEVGGTMGRLGHMATALRAGRALFITPDLPRKSGEGTAVQFLDREIYLPGGAALLAQRAKTPVYLLVAEAGGMRQRWRVRGPFESRHASHGRQERRAAVQRCMQWFADGFAEFLKAAPELWFLWGDKRWTRVCAGDERYSRRCGGCACGQEAASDEVKGVV
ncbi:MAG: hypothetical protein JXO22_00940 [Phycisphaerae bacterium]|nr:hypothetical protein [Phycisphaerae bacterium]